MGFLKMSKFKVLDKYDGGILINNALNLNKRWFFMPKGGYPSYDKKVNFLRHIYLYELYGDQETGVFSFYKRATKAYEFYGLDGAYYRKVLGL